MNSEFETRIDLKKEKEEYDKIIQLANKIDLKPVLSSNVAKIGYDDKNKLLKVEFKNKVNNTTYIYADVDNETYKKIEESESKGKALNENIIKHKDKYRYYKI